MCKSGRNELTPVQGGVAVYLRDDNFSNKNREYVNECMVDHEHAVFFGISKDNIDFFTYCNSGRYCASDGIAVLTNIEYRFDKPWIQSDIKEQVEETLQKTGQQILTLEQVKDFVLNDDKYKTKILHTSCGFDVII